MLKVCFRFLVLMACFLIINISSLRAAVFTVTSNNDSGPNTLRQAIADANSLSGQDTINFNVSNSITVFSSLVIDGPVIIDGGGQL